MSKLKIAGWILLVAALITIIIGLTYYRPILPLALLFLLMGVNFVRSKK